MSHLTASPEGSPLISYPIDSNEFTLQHETDAMASQSPVQEHSPGQDGSLGRAHSPSREETTTPPPEPLACTLPVAANAAPLKELGNKQIIFFVGPHKKDVYVAGNLFVGRPTKIYKMFKDTWHLKNAHSLNLPKHVPESVDLYREWLFQRKIVIDPDFSDDQVYKILVDAHILGEDLEDCNFSNAVMDAIRARINTGINFPEDMPITIYRVTSSGHVLRRLLLDLYSWFGSPAWLAKDARTGLPNNPAEFLADLAERLYAMRGDVSLTTTIPPTDGRQSPCDYHIHKEYVALEVSERSPVPSTFSHDSAVNTPSFKSPSFAAASLVARAMSGSSKKRPVSSDDDLATPSRSKKACTPPTNGKSPSSAIKRPAKVGITTTPKKASSSATSSAKGTKPGTPRGHPLGGEVIEILDDDDEDEGPVSPLTSRKGRQQPEQYIKREK